MTLDVSLDVIFVPDFYSYSHAGNEFGHPEWIDFPRDNTYDPSTGRFIQGALGWKCQPPSRLSMDGLPPP